jgi:hypothetical protein
METQGSGNPRVRPLTDQKIADFGATRLQATRLNLEIRIFMA